MSYYDALKHGETNVGLGMVPSKEDKYQDEMRKQRDHYKALCGELREAVKAALPYVKHCGASIEMRTGEHPQKWLVDQLESALKVKEL